MPMPTSLLKTDQLTDLLRDDHRRLKDLFREFEGADTATRKLIARDAIDLLLLHDKIEQRLLYPAAMDISDEAEQVVLRCKEAHHIANVVLAELRILPYSDRYFAKFEKLAEAVRAHIKEEEGELFPMVEGSEMDLQDLGEQMQEMRRDWENPGLVTPRNGVGALVVVGALAGLGWFLYNRFSRE